MESPIQTIKNQVDTAEYIIKHYPQVALRREANRHRGKCPFHDDKSPSFVVFPDGKYKCFSCPQNTSGDLVNFVSQIESLSLKEACEMIASNENIAIQFTPPNPAHEEYLKRMTDHTRRYWKNLKQNPDALYYLHTRGITDQMIDEFRLGLTDSNEGQFRKDILYISDRIVFPILETKSTLSKDTRSIAMAYRTMNPNEDPKYKNDMNHDDLNDPLYGVFSKGKTLYGYAHAAPYIKQKGYAIIVEGYVDVIALHQSGVRNVVASMGTSITDNQMNLLRSITDNVLLWLDPDKAGIGSMETRLPEFLDKEFHVSFCLAPEFDPADLCREFGFDYGQVASYIKAHSQNALNYMITKYTAEYTDTILQLRSKALTKLIPLIEKMSKADQMLWTDVLSKKLDMKL